MKSIRTLSDCAEKERQKAKTWQKSSKQANLRIDREEKLSVDPNRLPADAEFKGYEAVIVQDIRIHSDNIRFLKESYYSASEQKSYLAELPAGYQGQFGPGLRALLLSCYFAYGMTEPKISEFMRQFGISISSGQISNLGVSGGELLPLTSRPIKRNTANYLSCIPPRLTMLLSMKFCFLRSLRNNWLWWPRCPNRLQERGQQPTPSRAIRLRSILER